jgi:hypothetical protein
MRSALLSGQSALKLSRYYLLVISRAADDPMYAREPAALKITMTLSRRRII